MQVLFLLPLSLWQSIDWNFVMTLWCGMHTYFLHTWPEISQNSFACHVVAVAFEFNKTSNFALSWRTYAFANCKCIIMATLILKMVALHGATTTATATNKRQFVQLQLHNIHFPARKQKQNQTICKRIQQRNSLFGRIGFCFELVRMPIADSNRIHMYIVHTWGKVLYTKSTHNYYLTEIFVRQCMNCPRGTCLLACLGSFIWSLVHAARHSFTFDPNTLFLFISFHARSHCLTHLMNSVEHTHVGFLNARIWNKK